MHLDLQMILKNFKTKKMMKYIKFYLKDVNDPIDSCQTIMFNIG